nr:recombinase RecA [Clostridia bacterium]
MAGKTKKPDALFVPETPEDKEKALKAAMSQITKTYGQGAIMKLGENTKMQVSAVPTGSLTLDLALGIGGIPRGRIIEIYGPESSGKTTVALHMAAEVQKLGGYAAFVDAEHALDPAYAKALGVDIEELLVSQPDSGEQALEITESLVRSGAVDIVVVDSVAALVPQTEIDGDMGASQVGAQARLMSQAMRKLSAVISRTNSIVVFINQLREKVGVMYGNPETTPGGKALKYYASVRIDVRRVETLKTGDNVFGNRTRCKVVKNKVAPPFKVAQFDILYGKGISKASEIVDVGVELGIIEKSGSWYSFEGNRIGQGRDSVREFLDANPEYFKMVGDRIRDNSDKINMAEENFDDDEDEDDDFAVSAGTDE